MYFLGRSCCELRALSSNCSHWGSAAHESGGTAVVHSWWAAQEKKELRRGSLARPSLGVRGSALAELTVARACVAKALCLALAWRGHGEAANVKWEAAEAADDAALAWEERRGAPFAVRLSPLPISTWLRVTGAATVDRLRAVIGGTNATALARNATRRGFRVCVSYDFCVSTCG